MKEKLEMRELRGDDLFTLLGIFAKLEIQDDIVEMFKGVDTNDLNSEAIEARGMSLMSTLISKLLKNISVVKVELNGFLGELTGKTAEEIGQLGLATYAKLVKDFATKPELKDFFQSLSS
ncbi:MAG: hypothetical protein ACLSXK_09355 [Lactococcus petauri]|uniref:hypothetical protein n=1 Tax=Lactococcus petauri TaxID=1940789 RepID=UPI0018AB60A0|nr:hypothetical protein [Lactococcus petauri]MDC0826990.1 hypothetical protein [Lactococcus petauri]